MKIQPIILIGPARSGTKILRDTIATHSSISKIGFDINFIWKRYNEHIEHDQLTPAEATEKVRAYVQRYFQGQAKGKPFVIEKTVSNTLRIPFVLKIFPEAKFVFLLRDGRDAVESVMRQWGVAPDGNYLVKKFLSVPFFDVLPYVIKYAIDLIRIKLKLKTTESYVWGVKYPNFEPDLANKPLLEFCSIQWNACVNAMLRDRDLVGDQAIHVRYEEFINNPQAVLDPIAKFLGLQDQVFDISKIRTGSVGTSKSNLSTEDYNQLCQLIDDNLKRLSYVAKV